MSERTILIQESVSQTFRPRARILQLLGDELIGNPRLAVFELVKNAYDADANEVIVAIDLHSHDEPFISVTDDGDGMSPEILQNIWLAPGHDNRRTQRHERQRTERHGRLPLGEKGVGRFAVHKLGNRIRVVTRAKNCDEAVIDIDWNKLISTPYLDEAPVTINFRNAEIFLGHHTGTRIEIRELRGPAWTRGEVRRLYTQITSMCSPFKEKGGFLATLLVPDHETWITGLPNIKEIVERALWKFEFELKDGKLDWKYAFRQIPGLNLSSRRHSQNGVQLPIPKASRYGETPKKVVADRSTLDGIGPLFGEFHVFDREREVLSRIGNTEAVTKCLDEHGGVRVYRDGIRVYNYGEPGDDWLGLDLRRVNVPAQRISRNIVLGAVHLSLDTSDELIEKTNREGFVDNDACDRLRRIVLGVLNILEVERHPDKERLRHLTKKPSDPIMTRIEKPIQQLRQELAKHKIADTFEPFVEKIEHDYLVMQETLLAAGMSGLNLAVVFHEVERGVRALNQIIVKGQDLKSAIAHAQELTRMLDGFTTLLRRGDKKCHQADKLVEAARQFNVLRLRDHQVHLSCPLLNDKLLNFESNFSFSLILGGLNNLIDNAIYWLRVRWPEQSKDNEESERRLFIGATNDFEDGPAILVADNGIGLRGDPPDHLVRPFFSRKPDGMGLGLYYTNLALELNGGYLAFPERAEVEVPDLYDGAIVAMIFKGGKQC